MSIEQVLFTESNLTAQEDYDHIVRPSQPGPDQVTLTQSSLKPGTSLFKWHVLSEAASYHVKARNT